MPSFFPQHTANWKIEEPAALRRLSISLIEMAALTGVALRLYRALTITQGPSNSILFVALAITLGIVFLCLMTTLHLGNFTVRTWLWRAPTFAAVEVAAEALTSLLLIALAREPMGSVRAVIADWPRIATGIFFWRFVTILGFAVLLAVVVRIVRYFMLTRERKARIHTAEHKIEE